LEIQDFIIIIKAILHTHTHTHTHTDTDTDTDTDTHTYTVSYDLRHQAEVLPIYQDDVTIDSG
jgi:hypothetical protein